MGSSRGRPVTSHAFNVVRCDRMDRTDIPTILLPGVAILGHNVAISGINVVFLGQAVQLLSGSVWVREAPIMGHNDPDKAAEISRRAADTGMERANGQSESHPAALAPFGGTLDRLRTAGGPADAAANPQGRPRGASVLCSGRGDGRPSTAACRRRPPSSTVCGPQELPAWTSVRASLDGRDRVWHRGTV